MSFQTAFAKTGLITALCVVLPAASIAADCIPADKFGSPGPFYGSTAWFSTGVTMTMMMTPFKYPTGMMVMGSPELEDIPSGCTSNLTSSATGLSTNGSDLVFGLSQMVKRVFIEYCDGASLNNLSARVMNYDFIDSILKADGITLTSSNGTASISVQEVSGAMRVGTVEVSDGVDFVQFGGLETYIVSICAE